jgi:acyl dehydratase/putative sterol carrier protein
MTSSSGAETLVEPSAPRRREPHPYFEDFEVGQVFTGQSRTFSAEVVAAFAEVSGDRAALHSEHGHTSDGRPLVHGPLGLAGFFGWHHDLGLSAHVEAAFDTHWDFVAPIYVGDSVTYEMTVTRCRRTSALSSGVLGRHVVVRNQDGIVVQQGRTSALVSARSAVDDTEARIGRAFPTTGWARRLMAQLNESASFATETGTWDGTIGLRFGDDAVLFRVYRGRVLECGTRTPDGPTFVVEAPDVTWTRLITGPVNDFTRRTMKDEFSVSGSAYEYLRMTGAIVTLVDEARALAGTTSEKGSDR